jgi:hypothetical protein
MSVSLQLRLDLSEFGSEPFDHLASAESSTMVANLIVQVGLVSNTSDSLGHLTSVEP